jgi:ABC-type protease/lipase transport system fused ATPase/permease subunit
MFSLLLNKQFVCSKAMFDYAWRKLVQKNSHEIHRYCRLSSYEVESLFIEMSYMNASGNFLNHVYVQKQFLRGDISKAMFDYAWRKLVQKIHMKCPLLSIIIKFFSNFLYFSSRNLLIA